MLRNSCKRVFSRLKVNHKFLLVKYSALFINGPKATDTYVHITPYIDFPELIKHKEKLQEIIDKRKSTINLNRLEGLWAVYEDLKQRKVELEEKKREAVQELTEKLQSNTNEDHVNKLKIKIHLIKDNLKVLKPPLWAIEEAAITETLRLPNTLHPNTPETEDKVIFAHLTPPTNNKNHIKIGEENELVKFKNNENYYLLGDAAVFELGAKFYVSQCLKNAGYVQFSNPDFVKSLIIEGCGEDHTNSSRTFILHHNEESKVNVDNRLHLTGGASLFSFFAYHGKNVVHSRHLPITYFSIGRQYVPTTSEENNLFHTSQSSVIQLFGVAKTEQEADTLFQEIIMILKNIYSSLGYHFRLRTLSADKLKFNESLKISVDMYSNSLKQHVEVANLAMTGDFISKRLMFTYLDKQRNRFPHVIYGTALNVPKLFGCVLEQDGTFTLPDHFKIHNWSI